jgi:2-methylisocitrate lyase-like PEP mutase family enzyme
MTSREEKATLFHSLHVKGNPLVLYNIWDPGSAQAIASLGVKAIATGSHGVANSYGYEDGEQIPFELAVANAERVVSVVGDLPVTMDIETGYASTIDELKQSVKRVIATGIVGINLEDTILETNELRTIEDQVERISAVRAVADEAGLNLFINARTDLFKITPPEQHDTALVDQALERAEAYKQAGANGFFPVIIMDIEIIKQLCDQSPLPVNLIYLPSKGIPEPKDLAEAGASRISYGPGPYLAMIEWLKATALPNIS